MAWTTPKTDWETGELVAASDMNDIGENLAALDTVRETVAAYTTTADITAKSTDFVDVDSNLTLTITTAGGDVLVHFHGNMNYCDRWLDVAVDNSRIGDSKNGICRAGYEARFVCFTRLIQELSAGSHTFKLQSKGPYSRILRAGAQFWVREI